MYSVYAGLIFSRKVTTSDRPMTWLKTAPCICITQRCELRVWRAMLSSVVGATPKVAASVKNRAMPARPTSSMMKSGFTSLSMTFVPDVNGWYRATASLTATVIVRSG